MNVIKLSLKQLRSLISEVALSPSLVKNNHLVKNPLNDDNLKSGLLKLKKSFKSLIEMNLILSSWQHSYNSNSRQYDDQKYEDIQQIASETTDQMIQDVVGVIKRQWLKAHNSVNQKKAA